MKKIGLGTRPSEIKGRDKNIDFDGTPLDEPCIETGRSKTFIKGRGDSSVNLWKITLIAVVAMVIGTLLSAFLFFDFSFDLALDHAQFVTGQRELEVRDGESFNTGFSDGLILKELVFNGIYRLFPPEDITVEIAGIQQLDSCYNQDIMPFLKPEEMTSYDMLILQGSKILGKLSFTIDMAAQDWIARADAVEEKKTEKECYKRAVASDPDSEQAHIALGRIYEGEKKVKQAIAEYESALRIKPDNILTLKSLLALYRKRNSRNKLIKTYERIALIDVNRADEYFYEAGVLAQKKGSLDKAMVFFRKALSRNRGHINARQRLIKIYEKDKQWKRVAGNTRVLLEYDPKNPELYLYLSDAYLKMNNLKNAVSAARKAEKIKPGDSSICIQLALIHEKTKNYDKAIEYYKKAVKLNKKNAVAFNNLAILLEKKGRIKEAIKNYEKALALKPGNFGYCVNLADAYEKNKQWGKAVKTYKKVTNLDRKNRDAWEALAILYYNKIKNKWKAIEAYIELSRLEPKNIVWHQKIALLYEQLGKLDKARNEYKKILGIDSKNSQAKQKYVELSTRKVKDKLR